MVLEQGRHRLADGTTIEVSTLKTNHKWASVTFGESFLAVPTVLSHCQTTNGGEAVVTRQRNTSREGVEIRLQEEETKGGHRVETIGYTG